MLVDDARALFVGMSNCRGAIGVVSREYDAREGLGPDRSTPGLGPDRSIPWGYVYGEGFWSVWELECLEGVTRASRRAERVWSRSLFPHERRTVYNSPNIHTTARNEAGAARYSSGVPPRLGGLRRRACGLD
eukprot:3766900-Prymnesium_polylepis.1